MPNVDMLLAQIERAKRFASAMTNDTERMRFEAMAAEYQYELDSIPDRPVLERASSEN